TTPPPARATPPPPINERTSMTAGGASCSIAWAHASVATSRRSSTGSSEQPVLRPTAPTNARPDPTCAVQGGMRIERRSIGARPPASARGELGGRADDVEHAVQPGEGEYLHRGAADPPQDEP